MSQAEEKVNIVSQIRDGVLELTVEGELYSIDTLFAAAYVFIDRAYIRFDGNPKDQIKIFFEPKKEMDEDTLRHFCGDFQNELLATQVRTHIARNNKTIREYIVSSVLGSSIPEGGDFAGGLEENIDLSALDIPLEDDPVTS